ncbi:MAG: hypothetical protein ACOYN0_05715, partial [Phycisphaerales bacterium]
ADRVIFMPAAASRRLANAFAEGEAKGQELSAALEAPSDGAHGVLGIVQIWKGKQSTAYWLELTDVPAVGNKPASGDVEHKPESP